MGTAYLLTTLLSSDKVDVCAIEEYPLVRKAKLGLKEIKKYLSDTLLFYRKRKDSYKAPAEEGETE